MKLYFVCFVIDFLYSTREPTCMGGLTLLNYLDLYDFRRYVFNMYRERNEALLANDAPEQVWQRFREARDWLFAHHPQTALTKEQLQTFSGLNSFPYDPSLCVIADVESNIDQRVQEVVMDKHQKMVMKEAWRAHFVLGGKPASLMVYWLDIYGGGLFLPFRDASNGSTTYGGGRYLFDTIKGSDFLRVPKSGTIERVILDFNYAYNPSCAYNDNWVCPLSPGQNKLPATICAGEKKYRN
jgi:uncharacterized protein